MISISDFQILPFDKQCDFITVFADYLINRVELDQKYYLYYMKDYFVEVCYSPYESKVKHIHAFKNTDMLEPYLGEVSLELSV